MCGICGIIDYSSRPSLPEVEMMTSRLVHRGPDAGGTCSFESCALGHRRLSIIDLSEAANQPMFSHDHSVAIVFNGEIYNFGELRSELESEGHVFKTNSDTEVLLELYLEKKYAMLEHLNGMFSFAIWDDRVKSLFLARDRLGKKPLYYRHDGKRLSFSSELRSLLQDSTIPRRLSEQALHEYLLYDFVPGSHTIFEDVNKLPPASFAIFDSECLRIKAYWEPPLPETGMEYEHAEERLSQLLEEAVGMRLISDVPLGAFLSGGIDSSYISALMARASSRKVKTFSISFPGTSHDESSWARMAASHIGTDHSEHPVDYDLKAVFSSMIGHFGEPFGDSSAIPTWHLCRQTRRHVTVALSGDGGDELFGGYERYLARRFQVIYDAFPTSLRERVIEPFMKLLPETTDYYGTSLVKKIKLFVRASQRMREDPLAVIPRTFSRDEVTALTGTDYQPDSDPVIDAARQWAGLDPVNRMMFTDMQTYMAEDILTKVDRMSMAHALEVRCPLLDDRIVEFACRLPLQFKIRGRTTKRILKDSASGMVPAAILNRSKYGFQVPLGAWFKGRLREWTRERLFDSSHDFFRRDFVEKLWQEHLSGKSDHALRIWLLLVFNEWYDQLKSM
jgi:asparagine synthase (glutamine-hydrolysing)